MKNNLYELNTGKSLTVDTLESNEPLKIDLDWINTPSFDYSTLGNQLNQLSTPSIGSLITTINTNTLGSSAGTVTGIVSGGTATGINNSATGYGLYEHGLVSREDVERIIDRKLNPIYSRLAILEEPDSGVLEKYQSLREAYEHYLTLEALMYDEIQHLKQQK
jgi:hypothetical protein